MTELPLKRFPKDEVEAMAIRLWNEAYISAPWADYKILAAFCVKLIKEVQEDAENLAARADLSNTVYDVGGEG